MTECGHCETCKWWAWNAKWPGVPNDTGVCVLMGHNGDYPIFQNTLANAFSVEEADSMVFTHRTFGCVQWESKDRDE